ncbi:MAG: GH92 family glycosyl hydrolase [Alistipes sp.]|nr:GH92 family glycosyl hydrolase [Alistipes sp.]
MKKIFVRCIVSLSLLLLVAEASAKKLWQIGKEDDSAMEFALSNEGYEKFSAGDFGWEDKFFLVGHSREADDMPYVLPGVADGWAGTSSTAGLRTHTFNIFFTLSECCGRGDWRLLLDFVDSHPVRPPLMRIVVNGKTFTTRLPKGGGDKSLAGDYSVARHPRVELELDGALFQKGHNQISITSVEGSWSILDCITLFGEDDAVLQTKHGDAYLKSVEVADYLTQGGEVQPLLVGVEHLAGAPQLEVMLDGEKIYSKTLERGAYLIEVPMPSVKSRRRSRYQIFADGELLREGRITREPLGKVATPADYVDTHMGSAHSRWMLAPGPWMPFSMVKLSPDNQNSGWQSGYDPSFESIGTFSHIHEWTMAGLGTMPVCGELRTKVGDESALKPHNGYRSAIDKSSEECRAGYYKVHLTDYDIWAELTATTRCSFQRYTYPKGVSGRVMIDLMIPCEYPYLLESCDIRKVGPRRVEGVSRQLIPRVWSDDADQHYTLYFVIEFDRDIASFGGWNGDALWSGDSQEAVSAADFGCWAEFDAVRHNVVQMRTAISYVDMEGARNNLRSEVVEPFDWNFDAVREANKAAWNEILSRIEITTDDKTSKSRFYTNLYRSFCRNTFSDVDGRWRDATDKIQCFAEADGVALGCDAFWNTFWNLNQLWNLLTPEWSSRWVRSQLAMYDANGFLAKGPAGMKYIPVMVAEHEIPLMTGAWQMGIRDFNAEKVLQAAVKMQRSEAGRVGRGFAGNRDLSAYMQYGFVPADKGRFSNSLEYAYDDWCVSQLAESLGEKTLAQEFAQRGESWRNIIDRESGFARMRYSNGEWEHNFDPFRSGANHHYVEGNAWQLTFFVPQDVPSLIDAIGRERMLERLSWGFEQSEKYRYNAPGDQYWDFPVVQGNQQSMHFAFLFNWAQKPYLTQKWSRSILERYYGSGVSNAWLGDEDQGQMSAWMVMASIGLFQTDGGCSVNPSYEIASPLFEQVVIDLGNRYGRGEKLVIKANNASLNNMYIQSAKWNGKPLNSFQIPAQELLRGGLLELNMASTPNPRWGVE